MKFLACPLECAASYSFCARHLAAFDWIGLSKMEETVSKNLALLWMMAIWWLPFCAGIQASFVRCVKEQIEWNSPYN